MQVHVRNSAAKHRKMNGFRTRMKTRGGRKAVRNQRRVAAGLPKRVKSVKKRHNKNRRAKRLGLR